MFILTREERETIVRFDETQARANVYTYNLKLQRLLAKMAAEYPELCRLIAEDGYGGIEYEIEKKYLTVRPRRPRSRSMTNEQREAARARMQQIHQNRSSLIK